MSVPSVVLCPHCQRQIAADPTSAGQQVACPHCKRPFAMPSQTISADAPPPLPIPVETSEQDPFDFTQSPGSTGRPAQTSIALSKGSNKKKSQSHWLRIMGGALVALIILGGTVAKFMRNVDKTNKRHHATANSDRRIHSRQTRSQMTSVAERVVDIVAEQLGVSKDQITRETSLVKDLGADELDSVELLTELEKEFDINIPDDDAKKFETVGQVIDHIEKAVTSR